MPMPGSGGRAGGKRVMGGASGSRTCGGRAITCAGAATGGLCGIRSVLRRAVGRWARCVDRGPTGPRPTAAWIALP